MHFSNLISISQKITTESANIAKPFGKKLLEWMFQNIVNLKESAFSLFCA